MRPATRGLIVVFSILIPLPAAAQASKCNQDALELERRVDQGAAELRGKFAELRSNTDWPSLLQSSDLAIVTHIPTPSVGSQNVPTSFYEGNKARVEIPVTEFRSEKLLVNKIPEFECRRLKCKVEWRETYKDVQTPFVKYQAVDILVPRETQGSIKLDNIDFRPKNIFETDKNVVSLLSWAATSENLKTQSLAQEIVRSAANMRDFAAKGTNEIALCVIESNRAIEKQFRETVDRTTTEFERARTVLEYTLPKSSGDARTFELLSSLQRSADANKKQAAAVSDRIRSTETTILSGAGGK